MVILFRKFFILSLLISFFVGIIVWQGIYLPKDPLKTENIIFSVKKGENLYQIAKNLEKEGLIKSRFFFILYVVANGKEKKLKAGEYFLSPSMNIPDISKKIVVGDIAKIKVTIPEGYTVKDIENKLNLKLPGENLEGYLFPDTYYFPARVSAQEVVKIMKENFERKIAPLQPEIERQGKTIEEIIIMASLIEKEVYNTKECPDCKNLVSGILWKRLKNRMPLQVDATITYITGKKTTKIPIEDLKIDSPYNTYKYLGLPPAPICNPGLESILAALYPKESEYWYYLTTPEGKVIFSKTLTEHNINKAKYLK